MSAPTKMNSSSYGSTSWDELAVQATRWSLEINCDIYRLSLGQLLHASLLPFLNSLEITNVSAKQSTGILIPLHMLQTAATTPTSETGNEDGDNNALIRRVQGQVAFRIALWVWGRESFALQYRSFCKQSMRSLSSGLTKKQKSAVKQKTGNDCLIHDIIGLLQLAALRLPPERPFLDFVRETITKDQNEEIDSLRTIWETFEVDNPFVDKEKNKATTIILSKPKRKKKPNESTKRSKPRLNETPGIAPKGLLKPLKPTNSLLMGRRKPFVGSHFNSQLSNVHAFFRHVKLPVLSANSSGPSKRPNGSKPSRLGVPNSNQMAELQSATFQSPKRHRVTNSGRNNGLSSTVAETPCVRSKASSTMLGSSQQCQRLVGLTLIPAMVAQTTSPPSQRPVRAISLVAEAMISLQRRQDRRESMHKC